MSRKIVQVRSQKFSLRLAELIREGRLEIRIPTKKRTFHEKWILAEKEGEFSDIFGTANLTEQGSGKTGKQSNQERVTRVTGSYKDSPLFIELGKGIRMVFR